MEPTVVLNKDTVLIEEDVTDYSKNVDRISRTAITLYRWGEHRSMHIAEKGFPITDYQVETLPSGDARIAVAMEFPGDSVYAASAAAPYESP